MDRESYTLLLHYMNQIPPNKKTPEGQEFHIGEIVKISNPNTWFSKSSFKKDKSRLYQIVSSYSQQYRNSEFDPRPQYTLKHLFEDNESSWYSESELELVKGIDEIKEERDIAEYTRLKEKYK